MMRCLLFAALLLSACAIGYTRPDGTVIGAAIGHAEVRSCRPKYADDERACEAGRPPDLACDQVRGGYFSSGFAGVIEAALAGFVAYLTAGS